MDWQITSQGKLIDEWAVWGNTASLNNDLQAYWNFEDSSVNEENVTDVVSGINNGTIENTAQTIHIDDGLIGKAFNFTGDSSINAGDNANIQEPASGELALSLWVYPKTVTGERNLITSLGGWNFEFINANLGFQISGQGYTAGSTDLVIGTWQHVVLNFWEGDNYSIYVDTVETNRNYEHFLQMVQLHLKLEALLL